MLRKPSHQTSELETFSEATVTYNPAQNCLDSETHPVHHRAVSLPFYTIVRQFDIGRSVNECHQLKLRSPFDYAQDRPHQGLVCASGFSACVHSLVSDSDRVFNPWLLQSQFAYTIVSFLEPEWISWYNYDCGRKS